MKVPHSWSDVIAMGRRLEAGRDDAVIGRARPCGDRLEVWDQTMRHPDAVDASCSYHFSADDVVPSIADACRVEGAEGVNQTCVG